MSEGIQITSDYSTIINNMIVNSPLGNGVELYGTNNIVRDNIITDSSNAGIQVGANGGSTTSHNQLINNTINRATTYGIDVEASINETMANNTIFASGSYGIYINHFGSPNHTISGNIINGSLNKIHAKRIYR